MSSSEPATGGLTVLGGILWSLSGALTATILLAVAKAFSGDMQIVQVTFVRYLSAFAIICPLLLVRIGLLPASGQGVWQHYFGPAAGWSLLRACFAVTRLSLTFYAVTNMPFANAQAITLTNGIFMLFFAWALLGERISGHVFGYGSLVLAGAIMVSGPQFDSGSLVPLPALAALASAAIWGVESAVIKVSSRLDRHDRIILCVNMFALILVTPVAIMQWQESSTANLWALAMIGPLAIATQFANMQALYLAPANVIAPFRYAPLLFGLLIGIIAFGEWPSALEMAGMALIMIAGSFLALAVARNKQTNH